MKSLPLLTENPDPFMEHLSKIERFVRICYNRVSELHSVNAERKFLFTKKGRDISSIPPSQAALHEHVKRVVYQGGHCWGKTLNLQQNLPDPSHWGWKKSNGKWIPVWTTIDQASRAMRELIKCGCKLECTQGRCKCKKAGLQCTALCACEDGCGEDL